MTNFIKRNVFKLALIIIFIPIIFIIVMIYVGLRPVISFISELLQDNDITRYAVVIESGVEITNVHIYTFNKPNKWVEMIVEDEFKTNVTPGIFKLDYAGNVKNDFDIIKVCVSIMRSVVPPGFREMTPVLVRLRPDSLYVDDQKAADITLILKSVTTAVESTEFLVLPNFVKLKNINEYHYGEWYALNAFKGGRKALLVLKNEYMMLYFQSTSFYGGDGISTHHLIDCNRFNKLGLRRVRESSSKTIYSRNKITHESDCFNNSTLKDFASNRYRNTNIVLQNSKSPTEIAKEDNSSKEKNVYEKCKKALKKNIQHLSNSEQFYPFLVRDLQIYTLGNFSCLDKLRSQYRNPVVKVADVLKGSREACFKEDPTNPWLCLDLTYISILLTDKLGVSKHKYIRMLPEYKLSGQIISWSLGLALETVNRLLDYEEKYMMDQYVQETS